MDLVVPKPGSAVDGGRVGTMFGSFGNFDKGGRVGTPLLVPGSVGNFDVGRVGTGLVATGCVGIDPAGRVGTVRTPVMSSPACSGLVGSCAIYRSLCLLPVVSIRRLA